MIDLGFTTLILLLSGAGIAGFVSGFAGFGTGLIAAGFWFLVLPAADVPPLIVLASIAAQFFTLARLRRSFDWVTVRPYLLGGLVGVPAGLIALHVASPLLLRMTVGFFLVVYACVQLSSLKSLRLNDSGGGADFVIGTGGGFLGGFAGLPGPLPLIWLQLRGVEAIRQRATYQPFNLVILLFAAAGMMFTGQMSKVALTAALYCLPATLFGCWIGLRLFSQTNERLFRKVVLGLLLVSGATLLLQSAVSRW